MNKYIQKISNIIVSNLNNTSELGIFNGKMGLAIFFYRYAAYSGYKSYNDIADNLIDEIFNQITKDISLNFINGLSGIGVGLNILLKERFLDGNPNDVFYSIDELLLRNPKNILLKEIETSDIAFSSGLYLLSRLSYNDLERENKWINSIIEAGFFFTSGEKRKYKYNLSFMNSMLFIFLSLYKKNAGDKDSILKILNNILFIITDMFKNGKYEDIELILFKKLYILLPNSLLLRYKFNKLPTNVNATKPNIDILNKNLWWELLYNTNPIFVLSNNEIELYLNKKLLDYPFIIESINNELALLGLRLMQLENK